MDLINELVTHNSFGNGRVVEQTNSYIRINFTSGNREFIFPDAFKTYLTLIDKSASDSVNIVIEKNDKERNQKELVFEHGKVLQRDEQQRFLQREKFMKNLKIHPASQAAFWCEEEDQNKVFTEWRTSAGVIKSGSKEGQPNRPIRLNQNSACLLTAKAPGMLEKNRKIIGVYMVNESFIGKLCEDGYVPAHFKYRLRLSEQESEKMLFWNYYVNEKYPKNMTWNVGKYRYFDNMWMAQILRDIIALKNDPQERQLAEIFFKHFCQINQIGEKEIPKLNGALMQI